MNNDEVERILKAYLEDKTLEEFLEEFNITPFEAVEVLNSEGFLDEDILQSMRPADV